jgi:hypothetical protein
LGTHAQIFYAAKELLTLKFTTFEEYATAYISCINQICDAGIKTLREAAPYLFMASINPYYGLAIANVLADAPESLRAEKWTLEAVTRYFGLKRPSRTPTQAEKDPKKAPKRQSRQEQTATDSEKQTKPKCVTCGRRHTGICYRKDWTLNRTISTEREREPEEVAELPTKEPPKGLYIVKPMTNTTSAWWIDSAATYTITNNKIWFTTHEACELEYIQIGNDTTLLAMAKGIVKLPNGIIL